MTTFKGAVAITVTALLAGTVAAHSYSAGNLSIQHPWSRETAPGQTVGGGLLSITNSAAQADRLVSATSPVAAQVHLHTMTMDRGIMRMRQVEGGIDIPPKGRLELKPGGYHLMLMGLRQPLRQGQRFPVTLRFQRAGAATVQFAVQPLASIGPVESSHAGH